MSKITFHRNHKIKDCVGYADYIANPARHKKRGEELAHFRDGSFAVHSNIPISEHEEFWKMLQTESINCDYSAHASIVYIPQQIQDAYRSGDESLLKKFIADYSADFESRYPGIIYELAVHDNDGNMHLHRLDCERHIIDLNRVPEIVAKKSQARFKVDGKYTTKKKYLQAQKDGNLNVEKIDAHETTEIKNPRFDKKETFFKDRNFGRNEQTALMNLFNRLPYIEHGWTDRLENGYLPQKHIPKGDPEKYGGIASAIEHNRIAKEHNATLDQIAETEKAVIEETNKLQEIEMERATAKAKQFKNEQIQDNQISNPVLKQTDIPVLEYSELDNTSQPLNTVSKVEPIEVEIEEKPINTGLSEESAPVVVHKTEEKRQPEAPTALKKPTTKPILEVLPEIKPKPEVFEEKEEWINPYPTPTTEQLLALSECSKIVENRKKIETLIATNKSMTTNLENNATIKANPKLYKNIAKMEESLHKTENELNLDGRGASVGIVKGLANVKDLIHKASGDEETVRFYRENHLSEKRERHFQAKIKSNKSLIQELIAEIKRMYRHICEVLGLKPKNTLKSSEIAKEVQEHKQTINEQIKPYYDAEREHARETVGTTTKGLKNRHIEPEKDEPRFSIGKIKNKDGK